MDTLAHELLSLLRKHVTPPSFLEEPHRFALSTQEVFELCRKNGLDVTYEQLERFLASDLQPYVWTEICAAKLYVTGVKYEP